MKLIENWKDSYKLNSVQLAFLLALVNILVCFLPLLQQYITPFMYSLSNAVLASLIILLRVKSQAASVEQP